MVERKRRRPQIGGRTERQTAPRDGSALAGVKRTVAALLAAALLALPAFGAAQGFVAKEDKDRPTQLRARENAKALAPPEKPAAESIVKAERVTLEDAVAIVRQAHGGRLVSAKSVRRPAPGYRIRIDVDGRVKSLFVDAQGRMLRE